jgi:adenylate cyclase
VISSRELLQRSGLSEAALNSYIELGIVPEPLVPPAATGTQSESYFPDAALERIEEVRRLKATGLSMSEIAGRFNAASKIAGIAGGRSSPDRGIKLSVDDIAHPAYIVNRSFELTWCNELARREILGFGVPAPPGDARNIFLLLLDTFGDDSTGRGDSLLRLHLTFAKARLSRLSMSGLLKNVEPRHTQLIARMYDDASIVTGQSVAEIPYRLDGATGESRACKAYGIFLRDGILIVHTLD